jgi:hypothetical protein
VALPRFEALKGQNLAKLHQQVPLDKDYSTKLQPNQKELVDSGGFERKQQTPKVFNEMLVALLNS